MRRFLLVSVLLLSWTAAAQFQESITVARILLDVRVTDADGNPIKGLAADDFTVKLGGKAAKVESVTWIADVLREDEPGVESPGLPAGAESAGSTSVEAGRLTASSPGRLFVVFVQTDFARNHERVTGQMHFERFAEEMIDGLQPEDRVAVFSFDSHLKFRLDFTSDKSSVQAAIRDSIQVNEPPPPPIVPNPSLARRLEAKAMLAAPDSETALILIANALRPIEGPKTLLLIGWGLGQRVGGMVEMKPKWLIARHALDASRVSIFALDTTFADYHDLEIGLQHAAKSTGGFYAKTHEFPRIAINRLQRTLTGHYELELRRPDELRPGTHGIDIRVKQRGAIVLAPSSWMDRDLGSGKELGEREPPAGHDIVDLEHLSDVYRARRAMHANRAQTGVDDHNRARTGRKPFARFLFDVAVAIVRGDDFNSKVGWTGKVA
jgi:VWFA-related protein